MKVMRILWIIVSIVLLAGVALLVMFHFVGQTAYSQPEYSVDTFAELQEKMGQAEETYLLPDWETVQEVGFGASYTVWLKDRFHDDPSGYYICIYTAENYGEGLIVDCRLLEMYEEESRPTVEPNEELCGVGIHAAETNGGRVTFIYNDCYYVIQSESIEHSMQIAKSILDKAN